jgi:hypothetical protein
MKQRTPLALAILTFAQLLTNSQAAAQDGSNVTLSIQSEPESACVSINGRLLGHTPLTIDSLQPGSYTVTLQHPDAENWLTEPIIDTVALALGEQRVLRYSLRTRYLVTSVPFGAEVVIGDSVIGTTPVVTSQDLVRQPFMIRKPGFESQTIQPGSLLRSAISVPLKKIWQSNDDEETYFKESGANGHSSAGLYISGAATVLSGVAAAYLKIRADDRYQQYLHTGEGRLLSETHRMDTAAGFAIAATQIGLGLFTYFIFSQ